MSFLEFITLFLAIYGTVLSTWIFVNERRKNQRHMLVEISLPIERNVAVDEAGIITQIPGSHSEINVYGGNIGNRAIKMAKVGVLVGRGMFGPVNIVLIDQDVSGELSEGEKREHSFDTRQLKDRAKHFAFRSGNLRLVGYYRDEVYGFYKSKAVRTNIDEWIDTDKMRW